MFLLHGRRRQFVCLQSISQMNQMMSQLIDETPLRNELKKQFIEVIEKVGLLLKLLKYSQESL